MSIPSSTEATNAEHAVRQWAYAYAIYGAKVVLKEYGDKIVGRLGRSERLRCNDKHRCARYDRHTLVDPPNEPQLTILLRSAFELMPEGADCMGWAIEQYVRERITSRQPHDERHLIELIDNWGCTEPA